MLYTLIGLERLREVIRTISKTFLTEPLQKLHCKRHFVTYKVKIVTVMYVIMILNNNNNNNKNNNKNKKKTWKSLHTGQQAHAVGAYPGFCSMKRRRVLLLRQTPPRWDVSPSKILLRGKICLAKWLERERCARASRGLCGGRKPYVPKNDCEGSTQLNLYPLAIVLNEPLIFPT